MSIFIALVLIARTVISEWDGKVFCGYSAYCGTPSSINNCYKSNSQHTLTSNNLQKIVVKQSSQVSTCMEYETHSTIQYSKALKFLFETVLFETANSCHNEYLKYSFLSRYNLLHVPSVLISNSFQLRKFSCRATITPVSIG